MPLHGLVIEKLAGKRHGRKNFRCGNDALDHYLRHLAGQQQRKHHTAVYVAHPGDSQVIGYYTLSAGAVIRAHLPDTTQAREAYAEIPALRIGRLAVDQAHQGRGLATRLLVDALRRIRGTAGEIGVRLVLVDAKSVPISAFYRQFGFVPFENDPLKLWLPVTDIPD